MHPSRHSTTYIPYILKLLLLLLLLNRLLLLLFTDANVMYALNLAGEFEMSHLKRRCEDYLSETHSFHPMDLLHLASKFGLSRLQDHAMFKAAEIPRVEQYSDFKELDLTLQRKILTLARNGFNCTDMLEKRLSRGQVSGSLRLNSVEIDYDADSETD